MAPRSLARVSAAPKGPGAIDLLEGQSAITKAEWRKLSDDGRKRAFTVAGVTDEQVIDSVRRSLDRAIQEGRGFEEWKREVGPELREKWGRSSAHLETIFRNNVQSAYNAGRYTAMTTPTMLKVRPFWKLEVVFDAATSPYCKPLYSPPVVLPANDRWWDGNYPPRHHRCRATVISLSLRQARELGILDSAPKSRAQEGWGAVPPVLADWAA